MNDNQKRSIRFAMQCVLNSATETIRSASDREFQREVAKMALKVIDDLRESTLVKPAPIMFEFDIPLLEMYASNQTIYPIH